MKLTKLKLKEIIREELLNEAFGDKRYAVGGDKMLDMFDKWLDISEKLTKNLKPYDKKIAIKFKKAIDKIERDIFPTSFLDY